MLNLKDIKIALWSTSQLFRLSGHQFRHSSVFFPHHEVVVVVVFHEQVRCQVIQGSCRRGSWTHESIPRDYVIIWHIISSGVKSLGCTCSHVVGGSILIVVVRECIVVSSSVSAPPPLLGVGGLSVPCCFLWADWPILPRVWAGSGGFLSCF